MTVNIAAGILEIILIVYFQNYLYYLLVIVLQTVVGNGIVHVLCSKRYPYLRHEKIDKNILKNMLRQVKDIFSGKVAGYIYSSTDSLVISAFVGTVQVGFLNNYTMITNGVRVLANSITAPIAPMIGNLLASSQTEQSQISIFENYNFVRFLLAGLTVSPVIVLADSFVEMWVGAAYILPASIVVLLAADLYIHIIHSSCCDYITGSGLFELDKKISMAGAAANIITSVMLAMRIGVPGVLFGTVFSQMIFWVVRSFGTYKHCFHVLGREYFKYWVKQIFYLAVFTGTCFLQKSIYCALHMDTPVLRFVLGAILCEIVFLGLALVFCVWMPEERTLLSFAYQSIRGLWKRNAR